MKAQAQISLKALKRELIDQLRQIGCAFAEDEARLVIEHVLGLTAVDLVLRSEDLADLEGLGRIRDILHRRAAGEPLDHILGYRDFYGRRFEISREVLSPREDTGVLIDTALEILEGLDCPSVLDLGTGSGAIAITLAAERDQVRVIATDISPAALKIARRNADRLGVAARVEFCPGNWFDPVKSTERFDVIVSNPPYISDRAYDELDPEVMDFDPEIALRGGGDGLAAYRQIIGKASGFLKACGWLVFEIGHDQGQAVSDLCRQAGFREIDIYTDLAGYDRVVKAQKH